MVLKKIIIFDFEIQFELRVCLITKFEFWEFF